MEPQEIFRAHLQKTVHLTSDEFDRFYACLTPKKYTKGQVILKTGAPVEEEYFVTSGCLKSYTLGSRGKMCILQFPMRDWWIADYNGLYSHTPATTAIDCVTDAEVLAITSADREKICSEIPGVQYFFRWRTNKGYVAMQKRVLSLMSNDVKSRYEELIRLYPDLYNLVPKNLIAAYLGVSRETLSRLYQA